MAWTVENIRDFCKNNVTGEEQKFEFDPAPSKDFICKRITGSTIFYCKLYNLYKKIKEGERELIKIRLLNNIFSHYMVEDFTLPKDLEINYYFKQEMRRQIGGVIVPYARSTEKKSLNNVKVDVNTISYYNNKEPPECSKDDFVVYIENFPEAIFGRLTKCLIFYFDKDDNGDNEGEIHCQKIKNDMSRLAHAILFTNDIKVIWDGSEGYKLPDDQKKNVKNLYEKLIYTLKKINYHNNNLASLIEQNNWERIHSRFLNKFITTKKKDILITNQKIKNIIIKINMFIGDIIKCINNNLRERSKKENILSLEVIKDQKCKGRERERKKRGRDKERESSKRDSKRKRKKSP